MSEQEKLRKEAEAEFVRIFGEGGEIRTFFAPGRVNLIGEHTDYNGGHVFPCALGVGTIGVARKREDRQIRLYSMNVSRTGIWEDELPSLAPFGKGAWADYPKGVCWAMGEEGHPLPSGLDLLVVGDVPNGSGLSSSASLEVMTGVALKGLFGMEDLSLPEIARISQKSENEFNGMNCGIMDQFASAMGKKDCAIFLDTATLEYEYVPVALKEAGLVIINSKVKHSLVGSAYNDRRRECEEALEDLRKAPGYEKLPSLGALTGKEFEAIKDYIRNDICRRRARHAVYENERTREAVRVLKAGDLAAFGRLMNESHVSLRDDYEVSCRELDLLAELAWKQPGVIGSRMTGGGFGGCTVSLVKKDAIDRFCREVLAAYEKETGIQAECYQAEIGDGARELS